ncbi:PREDICTED: kelch-like protein 2 [Diuraphis noxia]|uniref:kelch-like protein 2 n=1 Tax=Diuraphis noxia TaxID=143948 RepID=UPI000763A9A3|nr:PREDICTED: kelch-like protein 2 [Diuraphis noxia]
MDSIHSSSYYGSEQMDIMGSSECESPINYSYFSHIVNVFEALQSLRQDEVFCDIGLKTDDGTIVFGHKVVLMSASQYFRAMFTNFNESQKNLVNINELNSTVLKLMIDFIYTGKIMISKENVQDLLPAANLLQLDYVKDACVKFLLTQLDPSNCLGIRAFADLHNCLELTTSSEAYIRKKFLDVVKGDEFLSLSTEEVIKLISSDVLNVPSEEKVYECVINWVYHKLDDRYDSLPKLMEHVRLPLLNINYISINVVEELLKSSHLCKDFIIEAFQLHVLKTKQLSTIPQTIRNTPRKSGQKVILVFSNALKIHSYDPTTNLWQFLPEIRLKSGKEIVEKLTLFKEHYVVVMGTGKSKSFLKILDLSIKPPSWISMVETLVFRESFGLAIFDDFLYVVGGSSINGFILSSVEVFDMSIQEWRMMSSRMFTKRSYFGFGVLNNLLYVVGGSSYDDDNSLILKSVECYDPRLDTWTQLAEMSTSRFDPSVGVMDGVIYAVGGENEDEECLKSVEVYKPSSGIWTSIADMHFSRCGSSVFALDGLLYVVGGKNGEVQIESIEIYNPNTNTWSIEEMSKSMGEIVGGVIVDKELVTKFYN